MPDKSGTIVFFLGSQGVGKTTLTEALLGVMDDKFNLNKDILAEFIPAKKPILRWLLPQLFIASEVEHEDSLYNAILNTVSYNMRGGKQNCTAIVEGNFGKRLSVGWLETHFGNLQAYDFCLVHVVCNDPQVQFERICARNAPKDKCILANGKFYNLTNKTEFEKFRDLRLREELSCIDKMSTHMRIIKIDNSSRSPEMIKTLVLNLKQEIEGRKEFNNSIPSSILVNSRDMQNRHAVDPSMTVEVEDERPVTSSRIKAISFSPQRRPGFFNDNSGVVDKISPLRRPTKSSSRPPSFDLETNKHSSSSQTTASADKKGSPFLSLWGREKKKETFIDTGRKSPRFEDQEGKPMTRHDSLMVLNINNS